MHSPQLAQSAQLHRCAHVCGTPALASELGHQLRHRSFGGGEGGGGGGGEGETMTPAAGQPV